MRKINISNESRRDAEVAFGNVSKRAKNVYYLHKLAKIRGDFYFKLLHGWLCCVFSSQYFTTSS